MADKDDLDQFKHIGIDANFIRKNADKQNQKVNQFYTGGQRDQEPQEAPQPAAEPKTAQDFIETSDQEPVNQASQPSFDQNALKQEILQEARALVEGLAAQMQQYANKNDAAVRQLQEELAKVSKPTAVEQPVQSEQKTLEPKEKPKMVDRKTGKEFSEDDVSISKMFNFSHIPDGKRK